MPTTLKLQLSLPPTARDDLAQDAEMPFALDLERWRVFDAFQTLLPGTPASDDLGLVGGTHGTDFPFISTGDVKASTITRKARITFKVPAEFVAGGSLLIRAHAGMKTTVAGTSATLAFAAYKAGATGGSLISGSDLVLTSAQSINYIDWDDYDFAISGTNLEPGDVLDILATIAVVDAATATAVIAGFRAAVCCTIRG